MFSVVAFQLAIGSCMTFSMDTLETMQLEKNEGGSKQQPICHKITINPRDELGRGEMMHGWRILARAETNHCTVTIGRLFSYISDPQTKLYYRDEKVKKEWKLNLHTPEHHYSIYDKYDAAFSQDCSFFVFAEYDTDDAASWGDKTPLVRVAVIDLAQQAMEQYLVEDDIGNSLFHSVKVTISSDGKLLGRLIKDLKDSKNALPTKTTVIIDQLHRGYIKKFVFDVDKSFNAMSILFTQDNKNISLQGTGKPESKSFPVGDSWISCGYEGCCPKATIILPSNLMPDIAKDHEKPYIGFCDETICKIIQKSGFSYFQPHDLVLWSDALLKKTGINVLPVKAFTQKNNTVATLYDCTQVTFHKNDKLIELLSSLLAFEAFETALFTYNDDTAYPPKIAEQPRKNLAKTLTNNGYLIFNNIAEPGFLYTFHDVDGRIVISTFDKHQINRNIITQTLGKQ